LASFLQATTIAGTWAYSVQNNPLTDAYAIFIISNNGTLILLNQRNDTIWYSNSSRAAQTPVAQLLDSGNFVVIDNVTSSSESYLWKSFDLGNKGQLLIYVVLAVSLTILSSAIFICRMCVRKPKTKGMYLLLATLN
jgi:hypothetical protein